MSATLEELAERVAAKHQAPNVTSTEVDEAIDEALERYSKDLPRVLPLALADSSSGSYTLSTVVSGWDERYQVKDLYQVIEGRRVPLDGNTWTVYDDATLQVFGAASGLVIEYTAPHVVTSGTSTIRASDLHAVINLATSLCCEVASRKASDKKSSSIPASTVDYGAIAAKWSEKADRLEKKYTDHVAETKPSGGVFGEWDLEGAFGFPNFHRSRWH